MENKKTSELLDLIWTLENTPEDKETEDHWDKYGDACAELRKRTPFNEILGEREEANEQSLEERIEENEEDIKLLKRHKHDEKNGDVLIRI